MDSIQLTSLENNISTVINVIKELMEENKLLKEQLNNLSQQDIPGKIKEELVDDNSKQLQIQSLNIASLSKEKEERIREKLNNALEKLNELQLTLS